MLCQDCPKRDRCCSPCSALEEHLCSFCSYQRERVYLPEIIEQIYEEEGDYFSELAWDVFLEGIGLHQLLSRFPYESQRIIYGHFWEGKSFSELARELGWTRSQIYYRYCKVIQSLRKSLLRKLKSIKIPFSFVNIGYNKLSGYGKGKEEKTRAGTARGKGS